MKTIIIPAHCSEASAKLFRLSLNLFKNEQMNIRLLQIRQVPDNYNDLLTLGRRSTRQRPLSVSFIHAINELKELSGERVNFSIDHIYGDSPAVFRNYAEHHNADLIVYDKEQWHDSRKKTGLNIFRMVSRCRCELMYVSGDQFLLDNELSAPGSKGTAHTAQKKAPASIQYQFNTVDARLNDLNNSMYREQVVSKRFSNLSRYFLKEDLLQKMLSQSDRPLLLLKK